MTDDDRLTIGAFARAAGLTASALRFYDECGLVRPIAVDRVNGYRYYSLGQLDEVLFIRRLREAGLPLADVRRVLAGPADEAELVLSEHLRGMRRAADAAAEALALVRDRDTFTVAGPVLAAAIGQVVPAADRGGTIPVLGGVLIETDATGVRLVATDRYRLAVRTLRAAALPARPVSAVVPAGALAAAASQVRDLPAVRVSLRPSVVRLDDRDLSTIDEPYPAYRVVLDGLPATATTVIAPRAAVLAAVGTAPGVRVEVVCGRDLRIGDAAPIVADVAGSSVAVSFLSDTLRAALSAAPGPDVRLRISRPDLPVVLRSADDGDFTTLIMPVRKETS